MPGRFRIGTVVARSFSIWGRDLPRLFMLALVAGLLPLVAWRMLPRVTSDSALHALHQGRFVFWLSALPYLWLQSLCVALACGAIAFAVRGRLRGQRTTVADCLRSTVHRGGPLLGVALCYTALWAGALGLLFLGIRVTLRIGGTAFLATSYVLPSLALCPFAVAVPVAALERSGIGVWRSWRLTRGFRLRVAAVLLLLVGLDFVLERGMSMALRGLPGVVRLGASLLLMVLEASLVGVFAAVGYDTLRREKDGDAAEAAEVFA